MMIPLQITLLFLTAVGADITWPAYNQQCADDAGPPFGDDEPGTYFHDTNSGVFVLDDECPAPLQSACASRPNKRTAYLEGPIDCNGDGWYCRIMPDPNWTPFNLSGDVNFGHCNTTDAIEDPGFDQDGHCHGSSDDSTYYWWIRDHWHRQYNGRLRCCCGWGVDSTSSQPLYSRRIANRCDYRRLVVDEDDRESCRDANEDHGKGFDDIGCDAEMYGDQLNAPIPEDDSVCWEIQRFGYVEGLTPPPSTPSTGSPVATPVTSAPVPVTTTSAPVASPVTSAPVPVTTTSAPVASPVTSAPVPVTTTSAPITNEPSPEPTSREESECVDSPLRMLVNNKPKACAWAAKGKPGKRCNKNGVASHCPLTCNNVFNSYCEDFACDDSEKRFVMKRNNKRHKKFCSWVGKGDEEATEKKCRIAGVRRTCRDTCGLCD